MHLGFTFYPKDWWTSDSFYTLSPFERYIYLELLFMMYDNCGGVTNNKAMVERRLGATIKDEVWLKVTSLMTKEDDFLTHKSVNKRLAKTLANRQNGLLGGRPKSQEEKPKKPKTETQKNPPYKEKEKENIKEVEKNAPSTTDFLAKKAEQLQEYFFRVAPHLTNQERSAEISKFLNKYPDVAANKAGALVNAWVGNMGKNSGKKMVY